MKQKEKTQDFAAEMLQPDYVGVAEKVSNCGIVRNDQDIHLGKMKRLTSSAKDERMELCCYTKTYESREDDASKNARCAYHEKVICVPYLGGEAEIFEACDIEVEEIKAGYPFEFEGVSMLLPRVKIPGDPYVMSLADALDMYHKFGFVKAEIGDIFIGTFSFRNRNAEEYSCPVARKHFGIGLSYMINVCVDGIPSVAVVRAFNETMPKTVICHPLADSVICQYELDNIFITVCGRMRLINGVMKRV